MKKIFKRVVSVMLVIALCSSSFAAFTASAADTTYEYSKKITCYLPVKAATNSNAYILGISTYSIPKKIKRSSVKSSDKSVASIDSLSDNDINLKIKKAGTTTISFKAGNKSYKTKLTVKKHTNPLITLNISGVKSGKNIVGKYKRQSNGLYYVPLKETNRNAKLTIKAKDGWAIKFVKIFDNNDTSNVILDKHYNKPASSKKTYSVGPLKKSKSYSISICCENKKNGASVIEGYILNYEGLYQLALSENSGMVSYTPE